MRFDIFTPCDQLKTYIKHFVISENEEETTYKVFPSTALVIGIQYRGKLTNIIGGTETVLSKTGVTGIQDGFKIFKNSPHIGTILVVFREAAAASFFRHPLHELFSQSISLDHFIPQSQTELLQELLTAAHTDQQRIQITEEFLITRLRQRTQDTMVMQAIRYIHETNGSIRIATLNKLLHTSASPLEKRFRAAVGTSPKKFSSIVRFQAALKTMQLRSGTQYVAYENDYFDQAHFIKDFKTYTGETPDQFMRGKQS